MTFQAADTVYESQVVGYVGNRAIEGPTFAQPKALNSADAAYNVFGSAFTQTAGAGNDGYAEAGGAGVSFAGILWNPKEHSSFGAAGSPLADTITLPNESTAGLVLQTPGVFVTFSTAANIGDGVVFDDTTGALAAIAPGALPAVGQTQIIGASVVRCNVLADEVGIIQLTGSTDMLAGV